MRFGGLTKKTAEAMHVLLFHIEEWCEPAEVSQFIRGCLGCALGTYVSKRPYNFSMVPVLDLTLFDAKA